MLPINGPGWYAQRLIGTVEGRLCHGESPLIRLIVDIWVVPLQGDRAPRPFLKTTYAEESAAFSPDGRWIAYSSNESGRSEVLMKAFPEPGPRKQVSIDGGEMPAFSHDGRTVLKMGPASKGAGRGIGAAVDEVEMVMASLPFLSRPELSATSHGTAQASVRKPGTPSLRW